MVGGESTGLTFVKPTMKLFDLNAAQHDGKLIRNNMYSYRVRENNDNKAVATITL